MSAEKKYHWYKVAESVADIPFADNNIAVVMAGSKKLCLGRFNNQYFSFSYTCPHAGGILSDGFIDPSGNVVCPLHRYKFSMVNGRNVSGEGYFLKTRPVEVREDGVYIGIEESGLLGWLH